MDERLDFTGSGRTFFFFIHLFQIENTFIENEYKNNIVFMAMSIQIILNNLFIFKSILIHISCVIH